MGVKLCEIVEVLGKYEMPATIEGDPDLTITGVATLEDAGPEDISFLSNAKYAKVLQTTAAGAVIVSDEQATPDGMTVIRTKDPYAGVTAAIVYVYGYRKHPQVGIDNNATIASTATIGEGANIQHGVTIAENVTIGQNLVAYPGCYIARDCQIGDDCILYPNVTVYEGCILGSRVTVHAGSVIGEDGLGYAPVGEKWIKIPQVGTVEIGDDVEIGANCAIDRATLGRTVIASGTKFSNLVALGHGSKVGENCMFVAQVGIAGSVTVGNHVTMAGKVGIAGHLHIGDNAELAAMAGVMHDVPPNTRVAGQPAVPFKEAMRSFSLVHRLPELNKQVKALEAQLADLKKMGDSSIPPTE